MLSFVYFLDEIESDTNLRSDWLNHISYIFCEGGLFTYGLIETFTIT